MSLTRREGRGFLRDIALYPQDPDRSPQSIQPPMETVKYFTWLTRVALLTKLSLRLRQAYAQILSDLPHVQTMLTASHAPRRQSSGVGRFPFPMEHLLVVESVLCMLLGQVQKAVSSLVDPTDRTRLAFARCEGSAEVAVRRQVRLDGTYGCAPCQGPDGWSLPWVVTHRPAAWRRQRCRHQARHGASLSRQGVRRGNKIQ